MAAFFKEFFGIGGFQRVPEGAWSWQHILFVSSMLAVAIGLAIILGKRFREKEEKQKKDKAEKIKEKEEKKEKKKEEKEKAEEKK